ncbi:hypothetical protein KHDHEBDM_01466 [Pectobacterium polaris]|nr:hypothetical protein KHDHEBDM_01466 [Pectobacterium polaris]
MTSVIQVSQASPATVASHNVMSWLGNPLSYILKLELFRVYWRWSALIHVRFFVEAIGYDGGIDIGFIDGNRGQ